MIGRASQAVKKIIMHSYEAMFHLRRWCRSHRHHHQHITITTITAIILIITRCFSPVILNHIFDDL
jgi:hypothetical protein